MQTNTLRPGLLVSMKTSKVGNVSYTKDDIEAEHVTSTGEARAKWETTRTIVDPEEFTLAQKVQGRAGTIIRSICASSAFGLLCPETRSDELDRAIVEARKVVEEFNRTAKVTRLKVYVIVGRIAPDDVEAVRAINSEVRDLMAEMEVGLERLDVKAVRDAANKARSIGQMLTPEAQSRIQGAIEAARSSARKIVKAGEQAAQEIDRAAIRKIATARTEFLDLDTEDREIAAPVTTGRAIDFEPVAPILAAPSVPQRTFELF